MAEAFFQVLIENVSSLIKSEVGLIMGVDKEMKKLADTLTTIQKVLEDAEDKQFQSRAIQNWLSKLNGMAFEIEDLLDECNTEFAKLKGKGNNFLKKVLYKRKVGRRMKEASEKLEAVAKDRLNFDLKEIVVQQPKQRDWRRETGFVLNDPDHNKIPGTETESYNSTSVANNKIREVHWRKFNSKIISSSTIALEVSTLTTIMDYNRLRILKLIRIDMGELPCAIGKLKQLRCLNLEHSRIRTFPHTFCSLYNLQILILNRCYQLESLPKNIRNMTNLRHIFLNECLKLSDMPRRVRELASLKTLSLFIVGDRIGNQLDELEHLYLGGRLEIRHLESVKNHLIAKKANLVEKPNLRDLVLRWGGDSTSSELTKMKEGEKVLEALQPHPNLVTLEIDGFRGRGMVLWMKSMKNITRIYIRNCSNCRYLSPLGNLPLLKSLHLWYLDALEYIVEENEVGCEIAIFPSMEELHLVWLPNLKGWLKEGEVVEMLPNLQSLEITGCESLRLTSNSGGLNFVTKLKLQDCRIGSSFPEGLFRHLTALQELEMYGNVEFEDVSAEEIKNLHRLQSLEIVFARTLVSLPQVLQHIPSLQSLSLFYLDQLTSLPDWLPTSLTQLKISSCPEIPSLPSSIQGISNLKLLSIWYCP
ncbi:hypothetical protein ACS0TY_022798 [Phlomoides rotata]